MAYGLGPICRHDARDDLLIPFDLSIEEHVKEIIALTRAVRPVVTFVRPACPSFLHARSDPISATREIARTESEPTGVANLAELHPAESNKVARDNAVAWHCVCITDDLAELGLRRPSAPSLRPSLPCA